MKLKLFYLKGFVRLVEFEGTEKEFNNMKALGFVEPLDQGVSKEPKKNG